MADTPSAAPAATPAQSASSEVIGTLPVDQKVPKQAAAASDDVEDTGDDLPAEAIAEAKKKVVEAAKKAYKLKVGGKDLEVDEAELMKRAPMGYSADQKWQEAAAIKKQTDAFIHLMQTNPVKALEQMGYDVDKMAEERIRSRIEEMQKSPEQLEREKMQRELQDIKAERERERTEAQQRETARIQDQFAIEIENDISAALDDNTYGFPKTPYVVKRVADMMITYLSQALDPNSNLTPQQRDRLKKISAKDVLPIVRDEVQKEQREMYALSPDEVFEQLVGKDRLNKYRRSKIKKTAAKPEATSASNVKSTGAKELQKAQDEADKNKKKMSSKDFFKNLGSR